MRPTGNVVNSRSRDQWSSKYRASWCWLLTVLVTSLLVVAVTSQPQEYRGEVTVAKSLCEAQCQSLCWDVGTPASCNPSDCKTLLDPVSASKWLIINCTTSSQPGQPGIRDCTGTCSPYKEQKGYIPSKPEVTLSRDPSSKFITLSWQTDPQTTEKTVYVISQRQDTPANSQWMVLGWVHGNYFQDTSEVDICTTPLYRVAAVSRFGSRLFSPQVQTPALLPGPPRDISLQRLNYSPTQQDSDSIDFTLKWKPPYGWSASDVQVVHNVTRDYKCLGVIDLDPVYVVISSIVLKHGNIWNEDTFLMNGKLPTYGIGCEIRFWINAVSRCAPQLHGTPLDFTLNLTCDKFPNYQGCHTPPVIIPGPVSDVHLTLLQSRGQFLCLVSWRPPAKLGSAGVVAVYHVFWGVVDLLHHGLISGFKTVLGHITVSGTNLNTDLHSNVTKLGQFETIGVLVRAAAPRQTINSPFGDITLANMSAKARTRKLLFENDDIFIIQVDDTRENHGDSVDVEIFWRRGSPGVTGPRSGVKSAGRSGVDSGVNATAIGVLWGEVDDVSTDRTPGDDVTLQDANFTVSGKS